MTLRVAFRADASTAIGTGHVMRCLTLAEALRDQGHLCAFICRDLPGNLNDRIAAHGFAVDVLAPTDPGFVPAQGDPFHAAWAGVGWAQDAAGTRARLEGNGFDWLVMDHYAFDARWQRAALPAGMRLAVLDDLADRPHRCDLLLDQNLGRGGADYDDLIPADADRLTGPRFALLRPDFAALRPAALAGRRARQGRLRHILVAMGGVDLTDTTGAILDTLSRLPPDPQARITVVMGGGAPALAAVRTKATAMPVPCAVLVDIPDMAARMAEADLAIGSAGGTAWERCALGLPSLLMILADNQAAASRALMAGGASRLVGRAGDADLPDRLAEAFAALHVPAVLTAMADRAAALCDGAGASRMVAALLAPRLTLRPATLADAETVWHWRNSLPPGAAPHGTPPLAAHLDWFARALTNPARRLFIAQTDIPAGHLRLDDSPDPGEATVSILLSSDARGTGLGQRLLARAEPLARAAGFSLLRAEVDPANTASLHLFAAAGYAPQGEAAGLRQMTRTL